MEHFFCLFLASFFFFSVLGYLPSLSPSSLSFPICVGLSFFLVHNLLFLSYLLTYFAVFFSSVLFIPPLSWTIFLAFPHYLFSSRNPALLLSFLVLLTNNCLLIVAPLTTSGSRVSPLVPFFFTPFLRPTLPHSSVLVNLAVFTHFPLCPPSYLSSSLSNFS